MEKINYAHQDVNSEDIEAVIKTLKSELLTQGPAVPAFESHVSIYCKVRHGIAVNSATSGLHIACLALGVQPGDRVWTTPITFVATANCAIYCGALVDFVDIDPRTYNMSSDALAEKLATASRNGTLPKVVIPVHLCGQSCEMERIHALSKRYGFRIIEDASHAIGGAYKEQPIGACTYSDITIFSFHPVKIITSGEGGMVVTNDDALARKLRLLRSHGISGDLVDMDPRPEGEIWNYQQIGIGFNYRMTDIHAALGSSQMQRIDTFVRRRHAIAKKYDTEFACLDLVTPWQHPDTYSAFHLYVIRLPRRDSDATQKNFFRELHKMGIIVNLHYIPVYRQPFYEKMGFRPGYCPNAEAYFREAISIPMYPALTDQQQDRVIESVRSSLGKLT